MSRRDAEFRVRQSRRQLREAREGYEASLKAITERVTQLEQGYQAQLAQLKTSTADELKRIQGVHAEDIALHDAGLTDPLGRQTLRQAWEAQPKTTRGASPSEWWGSLLEARKAHHADPEANKAPDIPRAFQGYLPALEEAKQPPKQQQQRTTGIAAVDRGATQSARGMDALLAADYDDPAALVAALARSES